MTRIAYEAAKGTMNGRRGVTFTFPSLLLPFNGFSRTGSILPSSTSYHMNDLPPLLWKTINATGTVIIRASAVIERENGKRSRYMDGSMTRAIDIRHFASAPPGIIPVM